MSVMNKIKGFLGLEEEEYFEETVIEEREDQEPVVKRQPMGRANNVVPFQTREKEGIRLILCEPRQYSDAQDIADNLRHRRPVVVNLQRVDKDQAKRIIDFLSGTVYALNGDIQKVGDYIFVCTPDHVDIQGTISSVVEE
ncbi:cell division protein SepF [Brevibacillus composti]|uniref:Cell division protein SepF n=1 Tax=Brevibacillus composti TaxID=2796470 RepID=A0A7T5JQ29_9BACL|nr:cell division protein SepF [Brevibacillus composti]QQE75914.1 cell division protein SepF [Brevibacillus composti]QUO42940.1 cell division protein SepF [Brevibacillus composti]